MMSDAIQVVAGDVFELAWSAGDILEIVSQSIVVVGDGAVNSVNGQTGPVVLTATDVGADPAGTAAAVGATKANAVHVHAIAEIVELVTALAQVEANRLAILSKADQTALSALALLVDTKADQSDVAQQIAELVGTDQQVLAAIQEIGAALAEDQDLLDALEHTVANRVRFDVATQALTTLQKANARTNIGAEEIGVAAMLIAQITAASIGAATAAQGAKADTALQSADVAPVALSGNYNDLSNLPTGSPQTIVASTAPTELLTGVTAPTAIPQFFTFMPDSDGTFIVNIDFLIGTKSGSQGIFPQFFINGTLVSGGTTYQSSSITNAQQCQAEFKVVKSGSSYLVYAWCRSHPVGNTLTMADAALTQTTTQVGTPVLGFNVRPSGLVTINSLVVQNVTLTKL